MFLSPHPHRHRSISIALLTLALGCVTVPPLLPEPSEVSSPEGVKVALKIEANTLALRISNQTSEPLHFVQSAIKLFKDKQFFSPLESPRLHILPPGADMPLRMELLLDGKGLPSIEGATLLVDTALSQGGRRIELPPFTLARNPQLDKAREGPHVSMLAGYAFNYFYFTPVHSSFLELRIGGHIEPVELTGRLRVQIGRSMGGQLILSESVGFGLLGRLHRRVWFGFELSALPMSWIFVQRRQWATRDVTFDAAPELRIDLWQSPSRILYLSARPGVLMALGSSPAFVSPNILIGLGYGYEHVTSKRRRP